MPFGDLADGQDAEVEVRIRDLGDGRLDGWMTLGLAKLGEDAGVEQGLHSATSRPGLWSRPRSSPSNDSPWAR